MLCGQNEEILGAFGKLRKATISYVMSVRPYRTTRLPLDVISLNWIFRCSSKIYGNNSSSIKGWQQ